MNKLKFYVCPNCNNLITSTGETNVECCSKKIEELEAKKIDSSHVLEIEEIDGELCVNSQHDMKKEHYISFIAYVKGDSAFVTKQYPEWNMQFRFQKRGHGRLYFYCTKDGLFYQTI